MSVTVLDSDISWMAGFCTDQCLLEGCFSSFEAAEVFARHELDRFYVGRDDATCQYLVFSPPPRVF